MIEDYRSYLKWNRQAYMQDLAPAEDNLHLASAFYLRLFYFFVSSKALQKEKRQFWDKVHYNPISLEAPSGSRIGEREQRDELALTCWFSLLSLPSNNLSFGGHNFGAKRPKIFHRSCLFRRLELKH